MRVRASIRQACMFGALLLGSACGGAGDAPLANSSAPASDPAPAAASAASRPSNRAADEAALIRIEQDYAKALIAKDRPFLMRFYSPEWRGGNWLGFWTKSTMLKSVLNERYVVRSMNVRDVKVKVIGDVGIVQGLDEEVSSMSGRDTSGRWMFTDVFERQGGGWVAVASHTSELRPSR